MSGTTEDGYLERAFYSGPKSKVVRVYKALGWDATSLQASRKRKLTVQVFARHKITPAQWDAAMREIGMSDAE